MSFRCSLLIPICLASFAVFANPTHEAAKAGKWEEVARLIREEGHVIDKELVAIVTQRGEFEEFATYCADLPGYTEATGPAVMQEVRGPAMERVVMASAEIDNESAATNMKLAGLELERLEAFMAQIQKAHLHTERAQLIIKEWPGILTLSQNLREHLQNAYMQAGRYFELVAMNWEVINNPRAEHGATLTEEVTEKGECRPTCVNKALTKSWWAGKTCDVWGSACDSDPLNGVCCTVPMGIGFVVLNIAQGAAILPTLPGFWYWKRAQTALKGNTDDNTEAELKLFLETMKTVYNKFIKG